MHTENYRHGYGCCGEQSRGPELYYGYCHESRRMRMMNYPDYVQNVQTGFSNMMQGTLAQPLMSALASVVNPATGSQTGGREYGGRGERSHHHHHDHDDCGCGCRERGDDCGCQCCIRCADLVEYARCGEVRRIPVRFDNDTRRERQVKLTLGAFATQSGQETGWQAQLSETEFKLGPCGEKTVVVTVNVDCSGIGTTPTAPPSTNGNVPPPVAIVDSCKVAYASLTAEGCSVRPLVLAVAVLPVHCYAHEASCGCGCCN